MKTLYTTIGDFTFITANYLWHNDKPYCIDCTFVRDAGGKWRYVKARVRHAFKTAEQGNESYTYQSKHLSKALPEKYKGFDPMLNLKAVTSVLKKLDYAAYVEELTAI